ncbi:hypothetical protein GRAN_0962 [Granulicella sibirica]|uniref:Uncharacterized protein n=2 Tax=Granulicella sibirica TaxID=2479048 RepID=A0A4Q0T404_9BACT|nr:hypothetical protein GRAN_0962 [Granulicella sibirica]
MEATKLEGSFQTPDHKVRLGAAKLAAELLGVMRIDPAAPSAPEVIINIPPGLANSGRWNLRD